MAKGMTKSEVLNALAEKTGKSRKEVAEMLDAIANLAYAEAKGSGGIHSPWTR
jgi:nucleoid DNA-binding protein